MFQRPSMQFPSFRATPNRVGILQYASQALADYERYERKFRGDVGP
jgi:hypothetical protein